MIKRTLKVTYRKNQPSLYSKEAILSLKFDRIETDKRVYSLSYEAIFTITEDSKKGISIENPMLDIYASGNNMNEAEQDLFDQFDYTYQRLNQFADTKLSKHLLVAKKYINTIVEKVIDK